MQAGRQAKGKGRGSAAGEVQRAEGQSRRDRVRNMDRERATC